MPAGRRLDLRWGGGPRAQEQARARGVSTQYRAGEGRRPLVARPGSRLGAGREQQLDAPREAARRVGLGPPPVRLRRARPARERAARGEMK